MQSKPATSVSDVSKTCVLVVDDSKLVRVTAKKMLGATFDVVFAEDGEEAWQQICANQKIQVVFTDIGMPNLDGYGLIQRIRRCNDEGIRNQPIIVITGAKEDEEVEARVMELGATDFVTKPFKANELLARAQAHASYRRDTGEMQRNAHIDVLTRTLNQNGLRERLEKDVAFKNRHRDELALIKFELDDLQHLHATKGKLWVDKQLLQLAQILKKVTRKEDSIGRCGSGQFLAILPMAKAEGMLTLARRVCEAMADDAINPANAQSQVGLCIGIVTAPSSCAVNTDTLLQRVDIALTLAKAKQGEARLHLLQLEGEFNEPLSVDTLLRSLVEGQERKTIPDAQFLALVQRMQPLMAALSLQQKQQLLGL